MMQMKVFGFRVWIFDAQFWDHFGTVSDHFFMIFDVFLPWNLAETLALSSKVLIRNPENG